eukprot:TRINITY_DN7158_c0_g3_i1.p1 TRINITY_DN7158_c0_g3~~TRINITY_DN7158_c0_g3_i1.p1  ORF type:complete len:961 (+),score=306.05 TRINITY_DN7158_c0_g3_i1:116-2884(+)
MPWSSLQTTSGEPQWAPLPPRVSEQLEDARRSGESSVEVGGDAADGGGEYCLRKMMRVKPGRLQPLRYDPPQTPGQPHHRRSPWDLDCECHAAPDAHPDLVRHVDNPYPDYGEEGAGGYVPPRDSVWPRVRDILAALAAVDDEGYPWPLSGGRCEEGPDERRDWTVYTGVAGAAVAELRAYRAIAREARDGGASQLDEAADLTRRCAEVRRCLPQDSRMQLDDLEQPWEALGSGCFGNVYKCMCHPVADFVAVKELAAPAGGESVVALRRKHAFLREILNLSKLRRAQVLTFYGWCEDEKGRLLLVTEVCGGGGLLQRVMHMVDACAGQRSQLACQSGVPVAQALAYIHQRGMVHLDVSARNVLIDDAGRYKLADAGLLCAEGDPAPVISVCWSPPEQIAADPKQRRATSAHDVWSFAMMLFEVLSGGAPYAAESDSAGSADRTRYAVQQLHAGRPPEKPPAVSECECAEAVWRTTVVPRWDLDPAERPVVRLAVAELHAARKLLDDSAGSLPSSGSSVGSLPTSNPYSMNPDEALYGSPYTDTRYVYEEGGLPSAASHDTAPPDSPDAERARDHLRRARALADASVSMFRDGGQCVSFFVGLPGPLAVAAAVAEAQGDSDAALDYAERLAACADDAVALEDASRRGGEDELLFGRAGYLYAVQWLQANAERAFQALAPRFSAGCRAVAERTVASGRRLSERCYGGHPPLVWHCHGQPYLGAAHGPVGVLTVLLRCHTLLSTGSAKAVRNTVWDTLRHLLPSGDMPIKRGYTTGHLVHWCHGAAGVPLLALEMKRAFGDEDWSLTEAAAKAASALWHRGLLRKGQGLCHGTAGSVYALLQAARVMPPGPDRDRMLYRAWRFVDAMASPEYLKACDEYETDMQRYVSNEADHPLSLMEGLAGTACLLMDMLHPEEARFPGWDV